MQHFRFIVTAILLACVLPLNATAKCKWQVNEPARYQSKDMKLAEANRTVVAVELSKEEGQFFLGAVYASQFKGGTMQLDSDTPLTMFFEDREPLELVPDIDAKTKRTVLGVAILSKKTVTRFRLTNDQVKGLRDFAVSKVRITFKAEGELQSQEFEIKAKRARKLSELASCMLEIPA